MRREVVLSTIAKNKLDHLLHFLESEWSAKVKRDFIKKLDNRLDQIREFPESCPKSIEIASLHKCVVTPQTTLYYKVSLNKIEIITLFDNRQDPLSLRN